MRPLERSPGQRLDGPQANGEHDGADREGRDVDPDVLSDEDLREIVKLARWRELLPRD